MRTLMSVVACFGLAIAAAGVQAGSDQDCIVEGTVKNKDAVKNGTSVYIAFHSATDAAGPDSCSLEKRRKVSFKEPKNAMIENVPAGSVVKYHYTEDSAGESQWQLVNVSY
ncbi:MAG: hypothetical protein ACI9UN_004290 [Granulosicoccus sp.]|jgi:hypothetical protein